jgi:hypothetical protein
MALGSTSNGSTAPEASGVGRTPVFLHDFFPIEQGFPVAGYPFVATMGPALIDRLVCEAWQRNRQVARDAGLHVGECRSGETGSFVGPARHRTDAIIVPMGWSGTTSWIAPLEADLELAAFGAGRSHLHLLGRTELPSGVASHSSEASLCQRLAVSVVRHVIIGLAEAAFGTTATWGAYLGADQVSRVPDGSLGSISNHPPTEMARSARLASPLRRTSAGTPIPSSSTSTTRDVSD